VRGSLSIRTFRDRGSRPRRTPSSRGDGGVTAFAGLVDAFLEHFWSTHPVDASFAGLVGYDHLLPRATVETAARERTELAELRGRLARTPVPDDAAARIDAALMHGYLASASAASMTRPRFANPVWYTGEIAFGLIALLLPGPLPREARALEARIAAIPDQLAAAQAHIAGRPTPADWVTRARTECAAIIRLLDASLPLHPLGAQLANAPIPQAREALERFERLIAGLPDADPAAGTDFLALLVRDVHAFDESPGQIERAAAQEFERLSQELDAAARRLDPARSWRACVAELALPDVTGDDAVIASLRGWNVRALAAGAELVTPAADYELDFAPLPAWASAIYADLYFLFYRSPAAYAPGAGSIYWATAPQSTATIKLVHAVHHGSIGHHTQNARARAAGSRLARIAAGDGASGIALLGGGTIGEGWACYAEDLLAETPGFYTPEETLLLTAFELRNVATCLGDIRLHTGQWTLEDMRRFYRDEAAFTPARVWSETTRNSIFPASRLMYWTGTQRIKALRAQSPLGPKAFHDTLLSYGAAPIDVIGRELQGVSTRR
jgi:hypothetical protein